MAFNWAGAAAGMDDDLQQQIRNRLLEREQQGRETALANEAAHRNAMLHETQQNSALLRSEREARIEAATAKTRNWDATRRWAEGVLQDPTPLDPKDKSDAARWRRLQIFRAKNFLEFGKDLPAEAVTAFMREPTPKMLSPEELAQRKQLIEYTASTAAKYRPRPSTASADDTAGRRASMEAINNYLTTIRQKFPGNMPQDRSNALAYFDANQQDAARKAGGFASVSDVRRALASLYGEPLDAMKWFENESVRGIPSPTAGQPQVDKDEESFFNMLLSKLAGTFENNESNDVPSPY